MKITEFMQLYKLILSEKPEKSNVIVWLQGDRFDRSEKVLELYKSEYSNRIIIIGNNMLVGKGMRPDENNISLNEMYRWLISHNVSKTAILVNNSSMNTKEQAEHIISLSKKNGWKKIILVGSSYYQPRAFLTFLKQAKDMNWNGKIINQPKFIDWRKKPSGRNNTAKFFLNEEIKKIRKYKYKNDLAPIRSGIEYLEK